MRPEKTEDAIPAEFESEHWIEYPEHVIAGIKKSQEQVRNGQTKSYEEVKEILAKRWPKQ
jgi:uncharacterized membrane protein